MKNLPCKRFKFPQRNNCVYKIAMSYKKIQNKYTFLFCYISELISYSGKINRLVIFNWIQRTSINHTWLKGRTLRLQHSPPCIPGGKKCIPGAHLLSTWKQQFSGLYSLPTDTHPGGLSGMKEEWRIRNDGQTLFWSIMKSLLVDVSVLV